MHLTFFHTLFDGAADFQRPGILFLAADFDDGFNLVVYAIFA